MREFCVGIDSDIPLDDRVKEPVSNALRDACTNAGLRYLGMQYFGIENGKHKFKALTERHYKKSIRLTNL